MNRHVADSHGIIDNSCYLCKRQFPSVQELAQHLMEEHSVDRNLTCRLCGVTLKTKSQFVTHLSRHAEVKAFKCSYCEKAYYSATHLDRHKQSCFGIEHPFPCSCCDKSYKSQQSLKEHFDAVHRGKSFRCGFCGKLIRRNPGFPRGLFPVFFMLGATIMTETSSHHMTIPSRFIHLDDFCNWADLAFPHANPLTITTVPITFAPKRYRPRVSAEKTLMCNYPGCGRAFYERRSLVRHQRMKQHGKALTITRRVTSEQPQLDRQQQFFYP
ncbi:hypothetical protein LSAT2_021700 [Lamellibrachia satsuma]|nr:hypothetical protein LSAT2_021700 [Lamellibrachia satsuma]